MSDKYKEIRDMTDEDRKDIHEFAMKRSREITFGIDELTEEVRDTLA